MAPLAGFFEGAEMPTAGWREALWPDPARVPAAVGITAGTNVVDRCSGDGWLALQIARIAGRVIAIDIDRKLLDVARLRPAESALTNCDFVEGDADDVAELASQPVDFAFMANAFHGIPEPTRPARGAAAALRPGGRFAIVNWHRRLHEQTTILGEPRGPKTELRMTPEQVIASVEPAGPKLARIVEVPPYRYAAIFERPDS